MATWDYSMPEAAKKRMAAYMDEARQTYLYRLNRAVRVVTTIWTCDMYGKVSPLNERPDDKWTDERDFRLVAMADTEQVEQRPKCDYRVKTVKDGVETTERCKSEKDIFTVKGRSPIANRPLETDVCGRHLTEAWRKWKIESADKRPTK